MHPHKTSAVIKYHNADTRTLIPIRAGHDARDRSEQPEDLDESYIYQALTAPGIKLRYIYVKDITNADNYERTALGRYLSDVQKRAAGNYRTFIAMPIRSGSPKDVASDEITVQNALGMLGLDLKTQYGFGNFEEHEREFLACFVDMMSELVQDLIDAEAREALNNTNKEVA
jgi:hypothetical protein